MTNGYVIDVNILFSGVLSKNEIYKNIFSISTFYTPDFALLKLNKYRKVILKKSNLKSSTLKEFTLFLFSEIIVVPDYVLSEASYLKAESLCKDIDEKDVAYVALAIEMNVILLTRDKKLFTGLSKKDFNQVQLFDDFIRENK